LRAASLAYLCRSLTGGAPPVFPVICGKLTSRPTDRFRGFYLGNALRICPRSILPHRNNTQYDHTIEAILVSPLKHIAGSAVAAETAAQWFWLIGSGTQPEGELRLPLGISRKLEMPQFWNRLRSSTTSIPNLGGRGQDLQSTFTLLTNLIKYLVWLTAIWAVAAGFLQTGRLIEYIPAGMPGPGKGYWADHAPWLAPLIGIPVYALKAFGAVMLIGLAAAMVGGFLGFLFGVPRPVAGTTPQPASASPAPAPPGGASPGPSTAGQTPPAGAVAGARTQPTASATPPPGARAWQASTNLTEISDWLTKIIVGVGLVEAKGIFDRLSQLSQALGDMLFDGAVGSKLVIPSVIVSGALVGFLYAYLFTQLVIAALMARTDAALSAGGTPSGYQAIVPRAMQTRKEDFSDYIQGLADANDVATLDQIAQALSLAVDPNADPQIKRRDILTAVGERVSLTDAVRAANAMDHLSNLLQPITNRSF
jgi:hypothetical protein